MAATQTSTFVKGRQAALQLAIVGFGLVGQRHAAAISEVDGAVVSAIVDPSDAAKKAAQAGGIPWYQDLSELVDARNPDGVILSTPTKLHAAQGIACVDAGLPVLVEKPLADDMADARRLVAAADAANVPLLVGHHRRHNPLIRKAHAVIAEGRIGEIRAVSAMCWFYKPDSYFDTADWRKRRGAGPISVNLIHDIDLMRHLCGEIVQVQAQASRSRRGYENEDVAAAILTFANGAIGTVCVSDSIVAPWSWEMTSREYPIYPATSQSAYQIGGSHGSLSIPDLSLWTHKEARDWWTPISATSLRHGVSDPLVNQMAHFAAVIRGEEPPLVSGREGLLSLAVVDAIQRAAISGNALSLTPQEGAEATRLSAEPEDTENRLCNLAP